MQVHVFKGHDTWWGFTQDRSGKNLPADKGPWSIFKTLDMNRGETPRWGVDTSEALDAIERDGYFVTSARIVITEQETVVTQKKTGPF